MKVATFLIDRHEVTNREFKEFVDRGGYRKREYWKEDFVRDGSTLPWEEAMPLVPRLDRPARPLHVDGRRVPAGHDDYPVSGVSWYEAAAYAAFAGKQPADHLPLAAGGQPGLVRRDRSKFSNFRGAGPAPVGSYRASAPTARSTWRAT